MESCDSFVCLGAVVPNIEADIRRRTALRQLWSIWTSAVSMVGKVAPLPTYHWANSYLQTWDVVPHPNTRKQSRCHVLQTFASGTRREVTGRKTNEWVLKGAGVKEKLSVVLRRRQEIMIHIISGRGCQLLLILFCGVQAVTQDNDITERHS